jgi:hypothetical protein
MTTKPWENQILALVAERAAALGFRYVAASQSCIKRLQGGKQALHLAFARHQGYFEVSADVALRIDALEELVQASNPHLSAKEKRDTYSLGVELGNLRDGRYASWSVRGEADIPAAVLGIWDAFETHGLPYLQKHQDMAAAFELLSSNTREASMHSPIHAQRAKRAIALAILLGEKDLEALVERELAFVSSVKDPQRPALERFISELRQQGKLPPKA